MIPGNHCLAKLRGSTKLAHSTMKMLKCYPECLNLLLPNYFYCK
uniref:Uncharacterized protein n=1 Tax=Anguilla anguilla TaxID=7936 RepID=A0A0E9U6Q6_ANGAN